MKLIFVMQTQPKMQVQLLFLLRNWLELYFLKNKSEIDVLFKLFRLKTPSLDYYLQIIKLNPFQRIDPSMINKCCLSDLYIKYMIANLKLKVCKYVSKS